MNRGEAAKIGGMDRQTLRDWVHRFNAKGPDGLINNWTSGPTPRLSADQLAELTAIVQTGPETHDLGPTAATCMAVPISIASAAG
jgi:transposase